MTQVTKPGRPVAIAAPAWIVRLTPGRFESQLQRKMPREDAGHCLFRFDLAGRIFCRDRDGYTLVDRHELPFAASQPHFFSKNVGHPSGPWIRFKQNTGRVVSNPLCSMEHFALFRKHLVFVYNGEPQSSIRLDCN